MLAEEETCNRLSKGHQMKLAPWDEANPVASHILYRDEDLDPMNE